MKDDLGRERRKQKTLERLGSNHPRCVFCGEADWRCLEFHHIAGQKFGEEGAVVCRNCHRKLSDYQKGHPPALSGAHPVLLEQVAHFLFGLADLLEMLVGKMREYGQQLIEAAAHCPPPYGVLGPGEGGPA
jgi:hypothetical protein